MKFLTATFASLLSLASGQQLYEVDPVRAQRAHEFYKNLKMTQIAQFDVEQQTQLIDLKVGGNVCNAFDDYAVYDFEKFSGFGKGDPAKKMQYAYKTFTGPSNSKMSMVYTICGGSFGLADKDLKVVNSPANTKVLKQGDQTCKALYSKDETKGNIYLLKDGECVQSFNGGIFDAKIETDKTTKELKQQWTIKYKSLQKCAADATKASYDIEIKGICVNDTTNTFTAVDAKVCESKFEYKSKAACFIKYIPMEKYMKQLAPFTGAIMIVVGIIMTFFGSRFIPLMIAFLVAFGVTGACCLIGYNFLNSEKAQMWHLIVLLVISLAVGILAGFFAWKLAKEWAVTILSFWLGIMSVLLILKLAKVSNQNITLVAAGIGGVIGAFIGSKYNTGIKKFGTAIIGSFILVRGISTYVGHFPSEFSEDEATKKLLNPESGTVLYYTIGYLVAFLVIAVVGAWFQLRKLQEDEEKEDMMEGEDEARVCGCF